jgi:hypothetical protein
MSEVEPQGRDGDENGPDAKDAGFSLTDAESAGLGRARLSKVAGLHLSLADITAEIQRLPEHRISSLARNLKSRKASTPALAQALRAYLSKANEDQSVEALLGGMHYGVSSTSRVATLSEDELAAILAADGENLGFLAGRRLGEQLTAPEEFGVTAAVRAAVWASMVCSAHEGSVAALAWLAADPPRQWTDKQISALAEAWEAVLRRHPKFPEHPAPIEALCAAVAQLNLPGVPDEGTAGTAVDEGELLGDVVDDEDDNVAGLDVTTPGGADFRSQLTDLSVRIDAEQLSFNQARDVDLPALAVSMEHGLAPPSAELARLADLRTRMAALLGEVADFTGGPAPRTMAEAAEQLEDMAETLSTESALDRIRLLADLVAPEYAAAEADSVRQFAAAVNPETDPATIGALDALVTLIELGSRDPKRSAELSRIVQPAFPSASVLILLAGQGLVRFDKRNGADPSALVGDDAAAAAAGSVAHAPASGRDPAGATIDAIPSDAAATVDVAAKEEEDEEGEDEQDEGREGGDEPDLADALADLDFVLPVQATATPTAPVLAAPQAQAARPKDTKPADVELGGDHQGTRAQPGKTDDIALYVGLVSTWQFALAGHLADARGLPSAVSAAHRLAAHACEIRGSAGPNVAAFADEIRNLDADTLGTLIGAQMLVYAASVRAGLLSPAAGAAGPLRGLTGNISRAGSAVEELTEALLVAFNSGAYLTAGSANAVVEAAGIETQHSALATAARDLLRTAGSRTIRYQAATELWKMWMDSHGYLGRALTMVAEGSRSDEQLPYVRGLVTSLRSRSTIEKAIDNDASKVMSGRSNKRIEARSRDKIIDWTGDVADVLAEWVVNVDQINRASAGGGWMAEQITKLGARVAAVRSAALAELGALASSGNDGRNAAVRAGIALLENALDLVSGEATIDGGTEIAPDRVTNGLLILARGLPMQTDPLLAPRRPVVAADIASIVGLLADGPEGWTSAFDSRSDKDDHAAALVLIEMLRTSDPGLARRLSVVREENVAKAISDLDTAVASVAARIDSDRLHGLLTDDDWSDLSARTRAYETESRGVRSDFHVMTATLDEVEDDRVALSQAAVEAARERMDARELTEDERGRVSDCIERGDLTTAAEYLETIQAKGSLPEDRAGVDHLTQFFPAFPTLFSAGRSGSEALMASLKEAIDLRQNPGEGALGAALAGARIDVTAIPRNKTAADRIDFWLRLATERSRALDGRAATVKPILEQLGYIVTDTRIPENKAGRIPGGQKAWMYLSGVRATSGKALIPEFGTRMSPSGESLRLLAVWGAPTVPEIVEQLRSEPVEHSVIVLYSGTLSAADRNEFAAALRCGRKLPPAIIVDDPLFAYLVAQPTPRPDITLSVALPFASAEPFTPDVAGLVPEEMFYGRAEELDQVMNMMGSCIVYGGRQLGKSALLRAAAREFDNDRTRIAIYQSIYRCGQAIPAAAVWATLWPRLAGKGIVPPDIPSTDIGAAVTRHITRWIDAAPDRQLLLLLDESDFFLDADAKGGKFPHVTAFKELMEFTQRSVKVVFAGLHQTARFERLSNHPLAHLGNPVCVGPLTPQHAYELLTKPLYALGYRFSDTNIAARVLALANNQPALIQLFGAQLLRRLQRTSPAPNTPPRTVTSADVEAVWADEALRTEFRKRFDWTLNLDPRYKIIAYCVAFHAYENTADAALTPTELRSECEQWWPRGFAAKDVLTGEFRALLDECVALGVLSYNSESGAYRLRTPNVLALLGSRDEVYGVLEQAEAQEPPESFDGSLLRPPFGAGHTRSPLTSAQLSDLLGPGSRVRVIVGSTALNVERCAKVLSDKDENAAHGNASIFIKETNAAGLVTACQQAANVAQNVALVLVDLKSASPQTAVAAWQQARDQIAAYSAGTLSVILLTTPAQAAMWAPCDRDADRSSGLTELHRYGSVGLRLWLTETTLPFQDEASRAELLEATGGWPILVNRVVTDLIGPERAATTAEALEPIRHWLAQPINADALVDACGLRVDDALAQAWSFLVANCSNEAADLDTFSDWLNIAAEDAPALTTEGLASVGYGSALEVVQVLRMLGVLVASPDDGKLRLEPVIAQATRTAADNADTTPGTP